jgi:hypothetical protein
MTGVIERVGGVLFAVFILVVLRQPSIVVRLFVFFRPDHAPLWLHRYVDWRYGGCAPSEASAKVRAAEVADNWVRLRWSMARPVRRGLRAVSQPVRLAQDNVRTRRERRWCATQQAPDATLRVECVRVAAVEAAHDDPAFASDEVCAAGARLFQRTQAAWSQEHRAELRRLLAPTVYAEWDKRLRALRRRNMSSRVSIAGPVTVQFVGLHNSADDARDRAVVRVSAMLVESLIDDAQRQRWQRRTPILEYWTLAKNAAGDWICFAVEHERDGAHNLHDPIVAVP